MRRGTWFSSKPEIASQFYLLSVISPIAALALIVFSPLQFLSDATARRGWAFLIAAGLIVLNLIVFRVSRNILLARLILTLTTFVLMLSLFLSGQIEPTNLFWLYLVPIIAYFFGGIERGSLLIVLFLMFWLVLIGLQASGIAALPYPPYLMAQFLFNLLGVALLSLLFESARATFEAAARGKERQLIARAEKLEALTRTLRRAQDELGLTVSKDEAILESIGDGVLAVDAEGKVMLFNSVAESITGLKRGSILGKPFEETVHLTDQSGRQSRAEVVTEALRGRRGRLGAKTMLRKADGTLIPIADSAAPIRGPGGTVEGAVIVFRDVTQERRIDELKDEFVSLASHELRTPMTAIKSLLSLIFEGDFGRVPPRLTQPLKDVMGSTERLIRLVNNMLNISRIEAEKLKLSLKATSLPRLVSDVTAILESSAVEKGVRLLIQPLPERPVVADPEKVAEILQNLVGNAIKFTERGEVTITGQIRGQRYVLSVSDTGIGISPSEQRRLFGRFEQLTPGLRRRAAGTGLGLYLSRALATRMGGDVWLEASTPNQGSRFALSLPLAKARQPARIRSGRTIPSHEKNPHR